MIGEPNRPSLMRIEIGEWVLFRLAWATTRQGYTPSGILILAWHKPSHHWKAWGCECDSIELRTQAPARLTFKATGSVNNGNGYQDWTEVVRLDAYGDRVVMTPGTPKLSAIKN